ncbi:MAG: BatD family protein, partial [Phycisphaerales bacterium]
MLRRSVMIMAVTLPWAAGHTSRGAEILCTVAAWETYVGAPVQLQVIIKDAHVYEPPVLPDVDGAEVRELRREDHEYPKVTRPGRGAGLTVTYTYSVIPRQAGILTIPPIRVTVDGELFSTSPFQITAKESVAGDLLYLELIGDRKNVYVGQPINVTLEIWIKPYEKNEVRMDADNMWRYAIDENASTWGPFQENVLARPPDVTCRTGARPDANGVKQTYFVYSLTREVWPERPGTLDANGVKVVADYPLKARRKRSVLLGRPYEVVESRPIVAEVENSKIVVRAPPEEGRPDTYQGAVGAYEMTISATPTEVGVGDPISLTLQIQGTGRMDLVQAPILADQESLTANFRVQEGRPAGTVDNNGVKTFSQTIRAKHGGVTDIPPIRFSYFDPHEERYVSLKTDPIPLTVQESTRSVIPRVVAGSGYGQERTELTAVEGGLLANYDDLEMLLTQQSFVIGWGTWSLVVFGPLLCLACLLARRHRDRVAGDAGIERRRAARKTALAAIRRASAEADGKASVAHSAAAVTGYVADRCNLPPGNITREDVLRELRSRKLPETAINKVDHLLAECEAAQYGTTEHVSVKRLIQQARDCVTELERRKL